MPVDTKHADYQRTAVQWQRCRDVAEGSDAVKARGRAYLPQPSGMDSQNYAIYQGRASFFGAFQRTIQGLAGALTRKPVAVTVPAAIVADLADLTLSGVGLDGFARRVAHEVLTVGRVGILLDYSESAGRPYWVSFPAEAIINWQTIARQGDQILSRIVLAESISDPAPGDPFLPKAIEQLRELMLDAQGLACVNLWRRPSAGRAWEIAETIHPTRRGVPLDFIPFVFVGPASTEPPIEKPPLLDLADTNLSHYRNSADLEWALFWTACPTAWASGTTADAVLRIGSAVAWNLGENGKAGMLEFSGQGVGAIRDAMAAKERMMAVLGARLLEEQKAGVEAAATVLLRHAGEAAALQTVGATIGQAITNLLRWHAWWMSGTGALPLDVRADLPTEPLKASAEDIKTLVLTWQAGGISFETFYHGLARGGWARPGVDAHTERHAIDAETGGTGNLGDVAQAAADAADAALAGFGQ